MNGIHSEHLTALEKQIDAFSNELDEYQIIHSIPGIGEKIAATIISEIGEIARFNHPQKLVAFAGVDPVSIYPESLRLRLTELPNAVQVGFAIPYSWPYYAA